MHLFPILFITTSAALTSLPQTPPSKTTPQEPARSGQDVDALNTSPEAKVVDGFLATWLVMDNKNEVALAQIAQQKATDPEVKQFAQRMIDEHNQFIQKLQPFATNAGAVPASAGRDQPAHPEPQDRNAPGGVDQRDAPEPNQPTAGQAVSLGHSKGAFDHLGLIRDLGDQCLRTARKELDQKQGADFDRTYMLMAVGGHMRANDLLTVFQQRASSSLKAVLIEGQRTVATHLEVARDYTKKTDGHAVASRDRDEK